MPNIINPKGIQKYVEEIATRADHPVVTKWCLRNLRNYLMRTDGDWNIAVRSMADFRRQMTPFGWTPSEQDCPEWIKTAFRNGESCHIFAGLINPGELREMPQVLDYLNAHVDLIAMERVSVPDAMANSRKWHDHFAVGDDEDDIPDDPDGIELVKQFDDGFTIVKLTSAAALQREGALMGHCVGRYTASMMKRKDRAIFSLRDPRNRPHVTMECAKDLFAQIKGKQNAVPVERYIPYVRQFVMETNYGFGEDGKQLGLFRCAGRNFDDVGALIDWLGEPDKEDLREQLRWSNTYHAGWHLGFEGYTSSREVLKFISEGYHTLSQEKRDAFFNTIIPNEHVRLGETQSVIKIGNKIDIKMYNLTIPVSYWMILAALGTEEQKNSFIKSVIAEISALVAKRPLDIYCLPSPIIGKGNVVAGSPTFRTFVEKVQARKKKGWGELVSAAKTDCRHKQHALPPQLSNFVQVVIPRYWELSAVLDAV